MPHQLELPSRTYGINPAEHDLPNLWKETFNIYSFNNPEYNIACFHLVMGQLLKNNCCIQRQGIETDPRISILYLKPTFSGGSAGYDFIALIFDRLGLKANSILDSSDAALIGSLRKETTLINEGTDEEKKETVYINDKGLLDKSISDLTEYDECSWIFNPHLPPYQEKVRNVIQMALNPIGSKSSKIIRVLKHGTITCEVECSLLLITYPPKNISLELLHSGFTQRFLTIPKTIDLDERMKNIETDIDRYKTDTKDLKLHENIENIVQLLGFIKTFYSQNMFIFAFEDNALEYFKNIEKDILTSFKTTNQSIKENIGSIMAASVRKIAAISMHHAAMRFDIRITKEDVEYAFNDVFKPILELQHSYFELRQESKVSQGIEDSEFFKVKSLCTKKGLIKDIAKADFINVIMKALKVTSSKTYYDKFKSYIELGYITESKDKLINFNILK